MPCLHWLLLRDIPKRQTKGKVLEDRVTQQDYPRSIDFAVPGKAAKLRANLMGNIDLQQVHLISAQNNISILAVVLIRASQA